MDEKIKGLESTIDHQAKTIRNMSLKIDRLERELERSEKFSQRQAELEKCLEADLQLAIEGKEPFHKKLMEAKELLDLCKSDYASYETGWEKRVSSDLFKRLIDAFEEVIKGDVKFGWKDK